MLRFYCLWSRNSQQMLNLPPSGLKFAWARLILEYRTILKVPGRSGIVWQPQKWVGEMSVLCKLELNAIGSWRKPAKKNLKDWSGVNVKAMQLLLFYLSIVMIDIIECILHKSSKMCRPVVHKLRAYCQHVLALHRYMNCFPFLGVGNSSFYTHLNTPCVHSTYYVYIIPYLIKWSKFS